MGRFDALTQLEEKENKTPKTLNSDASLNDLKGPNRPDGSAFLPAKNGSPSPLPENQITQDEQFNQSTPRLSNARTPVPRPVRGTVPPTVPLIPKVKRLIRQRQPFDIYEDQYERLKKIAGSEREFVNGRGMSQMVREAIDNYFTDHYSSKE